MITRRFLRFAADESGPTAVEYALMLSLIILVCIGAVSALGGSNGGSWQASVDDITAAFGGGGG